MPINNIASKYIQKPTNMRKFVTHLNKAGVLLPVILLEGAVTGGRTYQAYKRGGYTEARERLCEETTGAIFWLGGVKAFNAIGNWIGKKFLDIENPTFSLAKDAVRHPFQNMIRDKNLDSVKQKLVTFKFTKVITAVLLAGGTLGFVVPKINQSITRKMMNADKKKKMNQDTPKAVVGGTYESMKEFAQRTKAQANPSFGRFSIDKFATLTNNLENHDIYKLLATDTGVLAGRTYNARNNDERVEIFFRDAASIYFYLLSKDHVIKLLQKFDGFNGKLSKLDPMTALSTHNALVKQLLTLSKNKEASFDINSVKAFAFGTNPSKVDADLSKIKFANGDIIALEDFEKVAREAGVEVDEKMLRKAKAMSTLQPIRDLSDIGKPKGVAMPLLTKQQVRDVLSDSGVSRVSFLRKVMSGTFNGELTDNYKFIPRESIERLRQNVDDYVKAIVEYAEKNNIKEITPDVLMKVNKINFVKNAIHVSAGLGISALFLSTIIPKVQYWITKVRTGSEEFPGTKDIK